MTVRKVVTLGPLNTDGDVRRALTDLENAINRLSNPEVVTDESTADVIGSGAAGGGLVSVGPQGPVGSQGPPGSPGPEGRPGPGFVRSPMTLVTPSLAPGGRVKGQLTVAIRSNLVLITALQMSRLIFYQTAATRDADFVRSLGTPVTPGYGVLAEFSWAVPGVFYVSPLAQLVNNDSSENDTIYYTASNRSLVTTPLTFQFKVDQVAAA